MKIKRIYKLTSLLLVFAMLISILTGCSSRVRAEDVMQGIMPRDVSGQIKIVPEGNAAVADFAVRLFGESMEQDKNTLISPVSVLYALAMTANGADGNTLMQMESVLGMPIADFNLHLGAYKKQFSEESESKLHMANSIWFKNDETLTVHKQFLQTNADYYNSEIFKTEFDEGTKKDINNWVAKNTDGMIPKIIDEKIPENAIMYLVNALAFDAQWTNPYEKHSVQAGTFTQEDGSTKQVDMMHSMESVYLEDENATGFIKPYKGEKYAFAAILPKEGMSLEDYVATLTGESLSQLLKNTLNVDVTTVMPKFECEYSANMATAMQSMGMTDAFTYPIADFSKMASSTRKGNVITIERILHKTYISVGELGTKAGAATAVEMTVKGAMLYPENMKTVRLDRPFLYMIIDTETNSPLFMDALKTVGK